MSDRNIRILLWIASGTLLAAGAGIGLTCSLMEIEPPPPSEMEVASAFPTIEVRDDGPRQITEGDFRYVWTKPLRRPLVDPVAEEPKQEESPKPPPPVPSIRLDAQLIATLVDPDPAFAAAWFSYRNQTQKLGLNESIQGHPGEPRLIEIQDGQVTVELQGQPHSLELAKSKVLVSHLHSSQQ